MKNNVKIYDKNEIETIKSRLKVYREGDFIVVQGINRINRKTYHPINKNFGIYLFREKKLVKFNTDMINYWLEINDENISLFDVKNIMNILEKSYQDISVDSIKETYYKHFN